MVSLARYLFRWHRVSGFLLRFAPLWAIWVLVLLLPPSREAARLHFHGSTIDNSLYGQPWSGVYYGDLFDPRPFAAQNPQDPDFAYWVHYWRAQGSEERLESGSSAYYWQTSSSTRIVQEALQLAKRFPNERWIQALPLRYFLLGVDGIYSTYRYQIGSDSSLRTEERKQLFALIRREQRREPQNAFWWMGEAVMLGKKPSEKSRGLLLRASQCRFYDDQSLEARRRLIRVQAKVRSLSWEEKRILARTYNSALEVYSWWSGINNYAVRLQRRGQMKESLEVQGALLRLGHLMTQGNNTPTTARYGYLWQCLAIKPAPAPRSVNYNLPVDQNIELSAKNFGYIAIKNGRSDLAREANANAPALKAIGPWLRNEEQRYWSGFALDGDKLLTLGTTLRGIGFGGVFFLTYLGFWWMLANIFLWRAQGEPSSRRDRLWPVLIVVGVCLALISVVIVYFSQLDPNIPYNPRRSIHEISVASLGVFAFLIPPFWLAFVCAMVTARRHREELAPSRRLDLELGLTPYLATLERGFWPTVVCLGIGGFFLSWGLWAVAVWRDWSTIDFGRLLISGNPRYVGVLVWDSDEPWPVMYCILVLIVLLVGWFWKWRYAAPTRRPITQSGVRWWKETIGYTILAGSWLYLILALVSWPTYQRLDARIEKLLQHGELQFAPKPAASQSVAAAQKSVLPKKAKT